MNIPYYVFNKIAIDSFFIDKVSLPEDRIFLVIPKCENEEKEGIEGLDLNQVITLMREGYESLQHMNKKKIDKTDILKNLYNQSYYLNERQEEIIKNTKVSILREMYEKIFEEIETYKPKLTWYSLNKGEDGIYVCGKLSKSYTTLYNYDEKFRIFLDKTLT
ncbi:hypothetical protein [Sulfurisphaera tokodaii]|uniref:Uncharacterized protein n=2 Tax=Sulfurisphaera tokodaii TaxID=111955 RepID=Q96XI4_SULTO|nr:hypothetical protein [Sulfurisphaera tokodaii]BAB67643.1 hypothetical protein STK_25310 [Sulfurisphaera tokodaii str. 7]HII75327.1 hypothetical protein [Sulfurisphaera tokodaii]